MVYYELDPLKLSRGIGGAGWCRLVPMDKPRLPMEAMEFFKEAGRKGGKIGGKLAARRMTKAQRIARARKAGIASGKARGEKARAKRKGKP